MSRADGSSATIKSKENIRLQAAALGGWRESILVFVMVLAPLGLAIILFATGFLAVAGWQIARGVPAELPTSATLQLYGPLCYIAASWIDVAVVWRWSSRRGLRQDVFLFRNLLARPVAVSAQPARDELGLPRGVSRR